MDLRKVATGEKRPSENPGVRLADCLAVLGICVLFLALRWNNFNLPLIRDEGEYAYAARLLGHGLEPYRDSFLQKPPMVVYVYALCGWLAPHLFWFPRVLAGLCAGLATALLGLIGRAEFGRGVALRAMWLATPMLLLPGLDQFNANTEMFMVLPLMLTLAVFVLSRKPAAELPQSLRWLAVTPGRLWFIAGSAGAVTFWFKYTALPVLAVLFAAWSWEVWKTNRAPAFAKSQPEATTPERPHPVRLSLWKSWASAAAGAGLVSVAVLAFFLIRDGGRSFFECTIAYNRYYAGSSNFGGKAVAFWLDQFWRSWWVLFLLLPAAAVLALVRRGKSANEPDALAQKRLGCSASPFWFWLAMFAAAALGTGGSWYGQYYIALMLFWALLAALAMREVAVWLSGALRLPDAWAQGAVTTVVVLLIVLPEGSWMTLCPQDFARKKLTGNNPFLEAVTAAKRVSELTKPNDYVYPAGSEPEILCYANRFSPTRFIIGYPLMIPTAVAEKYQKEAIAEIEQHPPKVILFARQPNSWGAEARTRPLFNDWLQRFLAERYTLLGGSLEDASPPRWKEPLTETEAEQCSLLLFERRK